MTSDDPVYRMLEARLSSIETKADLHREETRSRHSEVCNRLSRIETQNDTSAAWMTRHEAAHGLKDAERPSLWVANASAWAWHHPKRTAVCIIGLLALASPTIRDWLVEHVRWAIGMAIG